MSDADNLEIKKRARRRLVGAAALALAAAIVLPMMMEQEPAPGSPDIQVTIPDRDADTTARPGAVAEARPADPGVAPAPQEEPPSAEPPRAPVPVPPSAPADGALPKPPATKPPATADEAARVRALLDGKPPAASAPAAPAKEAFVIQIGAFGDAAKASAISSELKQAGFSAYTEKAGAMTRVRVGPFSSRDEAEKAAAKLRAQGRNAVLAPR